jgi:hypothetical protein
VSAISDRHGPASLVNVNGNLTLDGILNVGNGGSFGAGAYRLLNYTGVLDDETLQLGILPLLGSPKTVRWRRWQFIRIRNNHCEVILAFGLSISGKSGKYRFNLR